MNENDECEIALVMPCNYCLLQPYAGPLAWATAAVPLGFGAAGLYTLLMRR
jgi:hypothetical protein